MARTESKVMEVDPNREQAAVEFMQIFHWNLMNAQHVKNKTKNTRLERRGDELYSVTETETEHFVVLTFSRDLDAPGIERIRALESEYRGLEASMPSVPEKAGMGCAIVVCLLLTAFFGLGIIIALFWIPSIVAKNKQIEEELPGILAEIEESKARQRQIVEECRSPQIQAPTPATTPRISHATSGQDDDVGFWDRMDKSDVDQLQEYLLRFPEGRFIELVKGKLEKLGIEPLRPGFRPIE